MSEFRLRSGGQRRSRLIEYGPPDPPPARPRRPLRRDTTTTRELSQAELRELRAARMRAENAFNLQARDRMKRVWAQMTLDERRARTEPMRIARFQKKENG